MTDVCPVCGDEYEKKHRADRPVTIRDDYPTCRDACGAGYARIYVHEP